MYADDTWMYGRVDGPMTEDTPWRPVSTKGVLRARIAERILAAGAAGRLQVGVVRAGELYGPGVRSIVAGNVFRAALRGWPVQWFGDPDLPLTPTFIDDFAATLAAVGTGDASGAAVWHVPHPGVTTGRALAAEACRQAGTRLRMVRHGSRRVRAFGHVVPLAGREPRWCTSSSSVRGRRQPGRPDLRARGDPVRGGRAPDPGGDHRPRPLSPGRLPGVSRRSGPGGPGRARACPPRRARR